MDEQNAKKLLDQTFNNDFDVNRFSIFVKELFNKFDISPVSLHVRPDYKGYIDSYQRIGNYIDNSKKAIDVLVVKLNKESIYKDRARTKQRNLIAKYLDINRKDAALVAFYGDDPQDWRFSFVKVEYQLTKDGSISKDLTPAKRSSFLVGVNEPNHTCRKQFLDLVKEEGKNPSLEDIEESFGIENVTKEFFSEYKELFLKLKESLEKVIERDQYVKKEFDDKSISTVDFSKKLLGQIVFIYFLQKKGWLGVDRNPETGKFNDWGSGPKNFLRKLFDKKIVPYDNFFNDILEPLFYEALATERDDDYSRFNCKIPFLNGGLFEPINDYDWKGPGILLENSIFGSIFETFDRFNFTVKEDEPLDREVAVDPEMLGKVFENLLEVTDRKSKGAFYTPREIVHYMCRQSLINYLGTNTVIPIKDIETFIQYGDLAQQLTSKSDIDEKYLPVSIKENSNKIDILLKNIKIVDPAVGSGAFPMGMMNEIVKARSNLSWLSHEEKPNNYDLKRETIENSLYGVDIDSSAVDIAKLRFWLSLIVDESDMTKIKPLPNLDHKIMCGNSLLEEFEGVKLFDEKLLEVIPDVDSLMMEEIKKERDELHQELGEIYTGKRKDDGRKAEIERELRKLERKKKEISSIVKEGTQQYTIDQVIQHKIKESHRKLVELRKLHKDFYNAESKKNKKEFTEKIDRIEWELIVETLKEEGNEAAMQKLAQYKKNKSKPFFLWKLYFSEVFQRENPGFDVVIGNPPYFQLQKNHKVSEELSCQGYETYSKSSDIYCIFYEKGINLLRRNGILAYITSNSWIKTKYGGLLRRYFKSYTDPLILIDFENSQVFDTAIVESNIFILKKSEFMSHLEALQFNLISEKPVDIKNYFSTNHVILETLDDAGWIISNSITSLLRKKMEAGSNPLNDLNQRIYIGILNGYNDAYIINSNIRQELIKKNPRSAEIIKPLLRGRDVGRYYYQWQNLWLINSHNGIKNRLPRVDVEKDYPAIYDFLVPHKEKLEIRRNRGTHWTNLRNCGYLEKFDEPKIIWGELSDKPKFTYDEKGFFAEATLFIMIGEDLKYLLSILNSKIGRWYFEQISTSSGMGTNRWKKYKIEQFPIKKATSDQKKASIQIVDQILSITCAPDYLDSPEKQARVKTLEKEIDQLIYTLYDLTPEEIVMVENFNKGK